MTYLFFYDKNKFLERRLKLVVEEMQLRGFQTNNINLIDESYNYHPSTFDDEWWGDWEVTDEAVTINMERIEFRLSMKEGWYKFWKRPILCMQDLISTRSLNSFYECPNCKVIHFAQEDSWVCWNCCKKIPTDIQKMRYY